MVKIIDITYMKAYLKHVANNATHTNAEEITQLLSLLEEYGELFDGTLWDWDTEPVNLELKLGSKPFNSRYYSFHRINKDVFTKSLNA